MTTRHSRLHQTETSSILNLEEKRANNRKDFSTSLCFTCLLFKIAQEEIPEERD